MIKKIACFSIILITIFLLNTFTFSQKNKDSKKYENRTLAEVTNFNKDSADKILKNSKLEDEQMFISVDLFHSKVTVQYLGKSRPISDSHKKMIKIWKRLQRVSKKFTKRYEEEILVKEDEKEYWIPIQKNFSKKLKEEIKENDDFTLLVIHLGGIKEKMAKEYDWLFLSTGYGK